MSDPRIVQARQLSAAARRGTVTTVVTIVIAAVLVVLLGMGVKAIGTKLDAAGTPAVTTTEVVVAEPAPAPAAAADDVADVLPTGHWILVLESKEQSRYSLADVRALAAADGAPGLLVVDSSATPGLKAGYWAIVYGSFATKSQASDSCYHVNRSAGGRCYPRYVG